MSVAFSAQMPTSTSRRNLVIFVTAHLVNPAGQPINQPGEEEEEQEAVTPPMLPELPAYKK